MTTETKQNKLSEEEQEVLKNTAERIEAILKETGTILQSHLVYSELAVIPQVRLAYKPKKSEDAKSE